MFMSIAVIRPTGPFQIERPSMVSGARRSPRAPRIQSDSVLPVIWSLSIGESMPASRNSYEQPLIEVVKRIPLTGSATVGPVMLVPPPPPGQILAGPSPCGLPTLVGGLKSGAK